MPVESKWTSLAQITCFSSAANVVYAAGTQKKKQGTFCFWNQKQTQYQQKLACLNKILQNKSLIKPLTAMKWKRTVKVNASF